MVEIRQCSSAPVILLSSIICSFVISTVRYYRRVWSSYSQELQRDATYSIEENEAFFDSGPSFWNA